MRSAVYLSYPKTGRVHRGPCPPVWGLPYHTCTMITLGNTHSISVQGAHTYVPEYKTLGVPLTLQIHVHQRVLESVEVKKHARRARQSPFHHLRHNKTKHIKNTAAQIPTRWSLASKACSRPKHAYSAPLPCPSSRGGSHTTTSGIPNHINTLTPPPARPRSPPPPPPCRPPPPPPGPRPPLAPPPCAAAPSPRCP